MMKYNTFILFGAPGSGKGTQGKTLGTIPRLYHCACGERVPLHRHALRRLGKHSSITRVRDGSSGRHHVELWREAIDAAVEAPQVQAGYRHARAGWDSANVGQAEDHEEMIDVKKVFHLACPDRETLFYRLKSALEGEPPR
jgi:adenylate kinase